MYAVTISYTCDDYKRPNQDVTIFHAETLHEAKRFAVAGYLRHGFEVVAQSLKKQGGSLPQEVLATLEEALDEGQTEKLNGLIDPLYDHISAQGDQIFAGEYVPQFLSIDIREVTKSPEPYDFKTVFEDLQGALS